MATKIKALGEIALRVENIESMTQFYADVLGLEVIRREKMMVFFKIAVGYAGHTQILALFDRTAVPNYVPIDNTKTTVDHLAFTVGLEDFEPEKQRLEQLGFAVRTSVHAWVKWRSLYIHDPEGNLVELVCFDDSIVA